MGGCFQELEQPTGQSILEQDILPQIAVDGWDGCAISVWVRRDVYWPWRLSKSPKTVSLSCSTCTNSQKLSCYKSSHASCFVRLYIDSKLLNANIGMLTMKMLALWSLSGIMLLCSPSQESNIRDVSARVQVVSLTDQHRNPQSI